jgi:hypothetical protein
VPAYQAAMWILPGVRKHRVNNFTKCQEISGSKKRKKSFFEKSKKTFAPGESGPEVPLSTTKGAD